MERSSPWYVCMYVCMYICTYVLCANSPTHTPYISVRTWFSLDSGLVIVTVIRPPTHHILRPHAVKDFVLCRSLLTLV